MKWVLGYAVSHTRNVKPSLTKENMNDRARAKAVKSIKMKEWKPTSKMFKNVGYKWVPTGRTFTIVGTKCPLTRFTSTKIVPPRIPVKSTLLYVPAASHGSHCLTTVDQDAPSPSNSQKTPETQSPVIPNDVEEDNHDLGVAYMNNDPFFGIPIPINDFTASLSSNVIPIVVHTAAPNSLHVTKWTKDHPLDNIIGELKRPVSTRLQLHEQILFCYYDAFLTPVKPKNYKEALTQACWIEAMQEELNGILTVYEVWELVPRPE
ncbi:hypothetical protein Tco_0736484 [Tanacetum coccineum]